MKFGVRLQGSRPVLPFDQWRPATLIRRKSPMSLNLEQSYNMDGDPLDMVEACLEHAGWEHQPAIKHGCASNSVDFKMKSHQYHM